MFLFIQCNDTSKSNLISRPANNNDIYVNTSEEISFNIEYTIIPNVDINGLELTFNYYDKDYNLIATKIEDLNNVKKGISYPISVSLFEFTLSDLFKIEQVSIKVTNGTVSYL